MHGWVRVQSRTTPAEKIASYPNWQLGQDGADWRIYRPLQVQRAGQDLAARLADAQGQPLADRDAAAQLTNCEIAVWRSELPKLKAGEFYWADLIGLVVVNHDGQVLGTVKELMATGANDVLVVRQDGRERLIPFVRGPVVQQVDLANGRMLVEWDAEF